MQSSRAATSLPCTPRPRRRINLGLTAAMALTLTWVLTACGGGGGGGAPSSTPTPTTPTTPIPEVAHGDTSNALVTSSAGVDYPLRIYLPVGYDKSPGTSYPVIYGLDGDIWFGQMATTLDELGIKAILVGIGRNDRRDFDYQVTGALAYYRFVTRDLVPFMESHYRALASRRTLVGHSFGGTFVELAFFMDQLSASPYFSNYVSLDGAFDENSSDLKVFSQEQALADAHPAQVNATYVLAGATCCHYAIGAQLYNQLQARRYAGLKLSLVSYAENHVNMFLPAYRDAMKYLFTP